MERERSLLLLLAVSAFPTPVLGQAGGLGVSVVDDVGVPIAGAAVTISHTRGFVHKTTFLADTRGQVLFPVLRAGRGFTIEVEVPGCSNIRREPVDVRLDEISTLAVIFGADACPAGVHRDALPPDAPVARDELLVFIGRRRLIREMTRENSSPDRKFEAQYDVVKVLAGSWPNAVIKFIAYDHYGVPTFSKYDAVVLYVARYGDALIHEKYLFDDVYPTRDGRWAGCGDPVERSSSSRQPKWKPEPIEFVPIDVSHLARADIEEQYPTDRFDIANGLATCRNGTPAPDLVQFKLGVLRARYAPFDLWMLPSRD